MDIPAYQHQKSLLDHLNPFSKKDVWEVTGGINPVNVSIKNLSILTQNVWFDSSVCPQQRFKAILEQIEVHNADVVCLQEVIGSFMKQLNANKFIQNNYYVSDNDQLSTFETWYGVVLLVRKSLLLKFSKLPFPYSRMGRSLICAHLKLSEKNAGIIGSAHFESGDDEILIRQRQWKDSTEYLLKENTSFVFMCGDFNIFKDYEETQFLVQELKWNDSWLQTDVKKEANDVTREGITFGIFQPGNTLPCKRIDRIFYQSKQQIRVDSVRTIGDEALTFCDFAAPLVIYPSDHLGLLGQFKIF